MRFVDEFRDPAHVRGVTEAIRAAATRPWTIMEVCGGQTHAIMRYGLDQLLPAHITLVHGPGCPVCVTPAETIDRAVAIAQHQEVALCTFGDMLRVPGTRGSLLEAKAHGADVRTVYSPLDAVALARQTRKEVVFFAVGFETTAPAVAAAILQARAEALRNFSILCAHVRVVPAMAALLRAPGNCVQGFLAAGHVCTVTGLQDYHELVKEFSVPIVATGFEPLDILQGILMCVTQLERGEARVANQYARSVSEAGNAAALRAMAEVFEVVDRPWRGLGGIARSGLRLRSEYDMFDAELRFYVPAAAAEPPTRCVAGRVLQGTLKPTECLEFGNLCTPENPLGAPMVSSEGACAAYYRYRRPRGGAPVAQVARDD
jgi:hydrogenase expression/formation protein HypD